MKFSSYFKNKIHRFNQSEFYKNIASLFTGMLIARLVPFAFATVIARLYAPSEFGIFVLYLTIASLVSIVATGKFEKAIILAKTNREKQLVVNITQKINTGVSLLTLIPVIALLLLWKMPKEQLYHILLLPFYTYFFSSIQILRNIYISQQKFTTLSVVEISRAIATGILQCLFFIFPSVGLFTGVVLAQTATFLFFAMKTNEVKYLRGGLLTQRERVIARRFIKFPKYSIVSEVMNFLSSQLPVLLFKPFFGDKMLGLYSFSHRYISSPVQLLSISISSVFIQEASSLNHSPSKQAALSFSLYKKQIVLGLFPFLILALWGEQLFTLFFGADWSFSGFLAQLISPWLFAVVVGSPLSAMLIVKEKQNVSMWYNILLLCARIISLCVGGLIYNDIVIAVALFSATGFVFFVFLTAYSLFLSSVSLKNALLYFLKILIFAVPIALLKLWI